MTYIPKVKVGEKFGYWTIKEIVKLGEIHCECNCGHKAILRQTDLLRGVTTKCPDCHLKRQRTEICVGYQSGDWTVISVDDYQHLMSAGRAIERKWHCRCKCGTEKWIRTSHLTGKLTQKCVQCDRDSREVQKIGQIPLVNISRAIFGAKARNIEWNVTNEYLSELFESQMEECALTGAKIRFSPKGIGAPGSAKISTASLDRIDSSKGYIEGNVQWVHKDVNKMKNNLSEKGLIEWCQLIVNYHNKNK